MNDIYAESIKRAAAHLILYHYTSFESLKKIIKNKSLRLTRLDKVNDPEEGNRITSLWKDKIFVTCFTYTLENADYFWTNYGKIRISFFLQNLNLKIYSDEKCHNEFLVYKKNGENHRNKNQQKDNTAHDWRSFDLSIGDIYYTDDLKQYIDKGGDELYAGLIKLKNGCDRNKKTQNWEIEAETRIRAAVRPAESEIYYDRNDKKFYYHKPPFDSLYLPLPHEIEAIDISPYCTSEEKKEISDYLQTCHAIHRIPSPSKEGTKLSSTVPPY